MKIIKCSSNYNYMSLNYEAALTNNYQELFLHSKDIPNRSWYISIGNRLFISAFSIDSLLCFHSKNANVFWTRFLLTIILLEKI